MSQIRVPVLRARVAGAPRLAATVQPPPQVLAALALAIALSGGGGGNVLLNGTVAPSSGTGSDGDFYINTTSWLIYGPKAGGAWPAGVSLVGPTGATGAAGAAGAAGADGADGKSVLNGVGAPSSGLGSLGDFYLDTGTSELYGPKVGGPTFWGSPVSLVGPAGATGATGAAGTNGTNGADGKTVLSGAGAPSSGLGAIGDFYIDTSASAIYGPKASGPGFWGSPTSLVGAAGATGATGATGPTGPTGAAETGGQIVQIASSVGQSHAAGNFTNGSRFFVTRSGLSCTGLKFAWDTNYGTKSVKCSLWDSSNTRLATVTISVTAAGVYTATFSSPVALTVGSLYRVSIWETSGGSYQFATLSTANGRVPARPFYAGMGLYYESVVLYAAGDAHPGTVATTEAYLVEPVLA